MRQLGGALSLFLQSKKQPSIFNWENIELPPVLNLIQLSILNL